MRCGDGGIEFTSERIEFAATIARNTNKRIEFAAINTQNVPADVGRRLSRRGDGGIEFTNERIEFAATIARNVPADVGRACDLSRKSRIL